jgi:arylsulfatase A-like enzyme
MSVTQLTRRSAATLLAGFPALAQRPRRPNILYVMTDDHPADRMGCAGHPLLRTPNMDRLAAEGVRFSNCFVTNSLCAPARATALTGCYSHINGVRGNSEAKDAPPEYINGNLVTYPELLKKAGYRTAVVGKWHLNDSPKGFDYSCVLPGQGLYFNPDFIENGSRKTIKGYATDITTDKALLWLDSSVRQEQPWLLVYQHKAPHRPFQPAPRHAKLWSDVELPYPETFDDDYATRKLAKEAEDMRFDISLAGDYKDLPAGLSASEKKRWIYQRFVKDHYRATVGVDENLGRVLDYLDKHRLADDTIVVYTSDNGFFLGEHGWYDKRWMYEPSLRIPLLVRYPRLGVKGRVDPAFVQNIDFAPTLLDLAGVPIPEQMQGRSLRPLLEGSEPADWRQSVYYTYYENSWAQLAGKGRDALRDPSFAYLTPHRVSPHRGVRTNRYKLIEYYGEGDYWELFDLQEDPHELRNVYGDSAYSAETESLKTELQRLRRHYRDL